MAHRPASWKLDLDDPRAPSQEEWDAMSPEERDYVVASLPSEFEATEAAPPEGDEHTEQVYGARTALKRHFRHQGRGVYIGTNLPVYYPGQTMFSPDVIAVLDVDPHPRSSWVVSREKKGLDFAMEVIVLGHRRKDLERNVRRYAELGIDEYFVFDRPRLRLFGYRLEDDSRCYEPVLAQHGKYHSRVLGLSLAIDGERLRFFVGDAALPFADEVIDKLEGWVGGLESRLADAEARAEEEAKRAEQQAERAKEEAERAKQEAERADAAEGRLRELLAELERLRRER
ncbi:MAG: Uma2 family endonuclease [Polyangiaceae bacterium]